MAGLASHLSKIDSILAAKEAQAESSRTLQSEYKSMTMKRGGKNFTRPCKGPGICKNLLCQHLYAEPPKLTAERRRVLDMVVNKSLVDGYDISERYAQAMLATYSWKFIDALNAVKADIDKRENALKDSGRIRWDPIVEMIMKSKIPRFTSRDKPQFSKRDEILDLLETDDRNLKLALDQKLDSPFYTELINQQPFKSTREAVFASYSNEARFRNARSNYFTECKGEGLSGEELEQVMDDWDEKNDGLPEYSAPGMRPPFTSIGAQTAESPTEKQETKPKAEPRKAGEESLIADNDSDEDEDVEDDVAYESADSNSIEESNASSCRQSKGYKSKFIEDFPEDIIRYRRTLTKDDMAELVKSSAIPDTIEEFFDIKDVIRSLPKGPTAELHIAPEMKSYYEKVKGQLDERARQDLLLESEKAVRACKKLVTQVAKQNLSSTGKSIYEHLLEIKDEPLDDERARRSNKSKVLQGIIARRSLAKDSYQAKKTDTVPASEIPGIQGDNDIHDFNKDYLTYLEGKRVLAEPDNASRMKPEELGSWKWFVDHFEEIHLHKKVENMAETKKGHKGSEDASVEAFGASAPKTNLGEVRPQSDTDEPREKEKGFMKTAGEVVRKMTRPRKLSDTLLKKIAHKKIDEKVKKLEEESPDTSNGIATRNPVDSEVVHGLVASLSSVGSAGIEGNGDDRLTHTDASDGLHGEGVAESDKASTEKGDKTSEGAQGETNGSVRFIMTLPRGRFAGLSDEQIAPLIVDDLNAHHAKLQPPLIRQYYKHCLWLLAEICKGELSRGPFKSDEISHIMVKCHMNSPHTAINVLGLSGNNVWKAMKLYLYLQMTFQDYFAKLGIERVTQFMYEVTVFDFTEYVWQRRLIMLAPYMETEALEGITVSPLACDKAEWPGKEVPPSTLDDQIVVHEAASLAETDHLA